MTGDVAAILTAAGAGTRLGADRPKALALLAGVPLVRHAAERLAASGLDRVLVTCPPGMREEFGQALMGLPVECLDGGPTRQASVAAALALLEESTEHVLVHDAARALVTTQLIGRVVDALSDGARAVIPGVPLVDTVKRVVGGVVAETVDRAALVAVQTPQGFEFEVLRRAHAGGTLLAGDESSAVSDDAGLVERFVGSAVQVVPGEAQAMKITTRADLLIAESMLASGEWR